MPGMPCSSALSTPTNIDIDDNEIPKFVDNTPLKILHPPVQLPSDEEANRKVAVICSAPMYYQVRSHNTHRRRYYMYNALDIMEENNRGK